MTMADFLGSLNQYKDIKAAQSLPIRAIPMRTVIQFICRDHILRMGIRREQQFLKKCKYLENFVFWHKTVFSVNRSRLLLTKNIVLNIYFAIVDPETYDLAKSIGSVGKRL